MAEDSVLKKRRQRHFWKWVTDCKRISRVSLRKNMKLLNILRSEDAKTFPDLYNNTKTFSVTESIKEFHRKVINFNASMRNCKDFEYNDGKFNELELFDGEITEETAKGFMKHYFTGYKSFTKHGGKSNHRDYQMHYLDVSYRAYQRAKRKNNEIQKCVDAPLSKNLEAKKSREEKRLEKKLKHEEQGRERLLKLEEREKLKKEKAIKLLVLRKVKASLRDETEIQKLSNEEKDLLSKMRKERIERHLKVPELDSHEIVMEKLIGSLLESAERKTVQHYIGKETEKRRAREEKVYEENEEIITCLYDYMLQNNACLSGMLKELESAKQLMEAHIKKYGDVPKMSITLHAAEKFSTREHKGVYHLPSSSSQVGAIVNLDPSKDHLQIMISSPKEGSKYNLRFVKHNNYFYDSFQYPLLFLNGDLGHSYKMTKLDKVECSESRRTTKTYNVLTPCMYYSSLYMEREGQFNYLTKGRRLFQQFVVDNYVKAEANRLSFIEMNQKEIRKERADILRGEDSQSSGQRVIIPASFVGGPRYMKERQQDALAFVTSYGSPDFFITFTMNPQWKELQEAIACTSKGSVQPCDRPDLVSRIFKLKVDALMDDLTKKHIFGRVKAHLYSTEWQKRGLPHVHILLWMEHRVTNNLIEKLISAEIPDKTKEPRLHEIVTTNMIHGPCKGYDESNALGCQGKHGSRQKCGKDFPKVCRDTTFFGNNGYPLYKRRSVGEGGHSFVKKVKGQAVTVDNSWVVPYNPYLCLKYNAHINVECSNSIKCIAYVTKYVNKGCDRILFTKTGDSDTVNEVKNYQEARFVNANEATWKIFKYLIHKSYPAVFTLDLHLEGENEVFFNEHLSEAEIKKKISKDTHLTAFFKLCAHNEFAADLCYHQLPNHFLYDNKNSVWVERKTRSSALRRIRAVTNKTVELFYMRLLLTHKKGPKSFKDLRTIEGQSYSSYREAVKAMGLLNDEETWKTTIMEIINHTNDRRQLRATYASMLVFSDLEDQSTIWEETKDLFASDFLHHYKLTEYNDEIYLDALDDIQEHVWNCGGGNIDQYGLPASRGGEKTTNMIRRERSYNKEKLAEEVKEKSALLNHKQRHCYDTVLARIENSKKYANNGIFIDASGGTGKSFVLNTLLDTVRSHGKIALAVASSGIAATVLHGGRTAHNMFKIPLMEYNEVRACGVRKNSELAKLLKMTSLIVWDEVVMANKNTLTALDITLRDILEEEKFMGGIVFVCAGDFR
ncbi:uncharacterized protein LOC143022743 [Oratosquilla oratoria]|uniref:uncharacterized protein LOC143022743 n=1 Tax=Oratosquilla oratoria TaxID=337810 RepID=UPI003F76E697